LQNISLQGAVVFHYVICWIN